MRSIKVIFLSLITLLVVGYLSYNYRTNTEINNYYRVYYKENILGTVLSRDDMEKYIDAKSSEIKDKYKVDNVYVSSDIRFESIASYKENITSIEDMYNKIINSSPLTIDGYTIRIKREDREDLKIHVLNEGIFEEAVNNFIYTYVGKDRYYSYLNDNQPKIVETGDIIENVYIENDMTIKEERISVSEKIYNDSNELSKYLVFGTTENQGTYKVKKGDTITKIAYNNEISVDEFLISNPSYTNASNLLMAGDVVSIGKTNPQINVVIETYSIEDNASKYKQEIRYDETQFVGFEQIIQNGKDGIDRTTQRNKYVNGNIVYVDPISSVSLVDSIPQIVIRGDKERTNIGDLNYWQWPTIGGWKIVSGFFYRINPYTGKHEHHSGIDIAGVGYGSNVYAANNGTVVAKRWQDDYGYFIIINHNNGYRTTYAHMSRFANNIKVGDTVVMGQVIGYIGSTGWSTGPHLHFEIHKNGVRINPLSVY